MISSIEIPLRDTDEVSENLQFINKDELVYYVKFKIHCIGDRIMHRPTTRWRRGTWYFETRKFATKYLG